MSALCLDHAREHASEACSMYTTPQNSVACANQACLAWSRAGANTPQYASMVSIGPYLKHFTTNSSSIALRDFVLCHAAVIWIF